MYKTILVAYDGSEGAAKALNSAIYMAKTCKANIVALWVGGYRAYYHETVAEIDEENKAVESFANRLRKDVKTISQKENLNIEFSHVQGNPAKLIVEYAIKNKVDLIVMGCGGHSGLWGNNLGHVTDKVSENAKCNVLIVRN